MYWDFVVGEILATILRFLGLVAVLKVHDDPSLERLARSCLHYYLGHY